MKFVFFVFMSSFFLSCDDNDNNDSLMDEPSSVVFVRTTEMILTMENSDIVNSQSSCYDQDGFNGTSFSGQCNFGLSFSPGTIVFGELNFFSDELDSSENLTQDIIDNADNYLIVFDTNFDGQDSDIKFEYLSPFDTNNEPLGVNFKLEIISVNGLNHCPRINASLYYLPNFGKANIPLSGFGDSTSQQIRNEIIENGGYAIANVITSSNCFD